MVIYSTFAFKMDFGKFRTVNLNEFPNSKKKYPVFFVYPVFPRIICNESDIRIKSLFGNLQINYEDIVDFISDSFQLERIISIGYKRNGQIRWVSLRRDAGWGGDYAFD